jgi:hypothetical protein
MATEPTGLIPAPLGGTPPISFGGGVPGGPAYDPIERLPKGAQDRLRALRQASLDRHAVTVPHEELRAASMARQSAQAALKRLTDHPHQFGLGLAQDHPSVRLATKTLRQAEDDFERLKARSEAKALAWQAASAASANVESWLKHGRPQNTTLTDWDGSAPQLVRGEKSVFDQIENRRRRARELRADLARIAASPYPSAYCKTRIREQVEILANQGTPSITNVVEHDREIEWPTQEVRSEVFSEPRALAFATVPAGLALVAFLCKPALLAALDKMAMEESDDSVALTHEQRQLRTDEVQRDLLAVEMEESALTWSAQEQNLPINFRSDLDPRAILLVIMSTLAKPNGQETTTPFVFDVLYPGGGR